MTTIRARLGERSKRPLVGLLIVTCLIVPTLNASAGAAAPNARISSAARARIARLAAPRIKVVGHKLIWSRVEGVRTYVLARHRLGHASVYRVIAKNSITPRPVPGATVRYRVKTNVSGSAWAHAVTITYTAHGGIVKSSAAGSDPSGSGSAGSGSAPGAGSGSGSESSSGSGSGSSGSGSGSGSGAGSGGLGGPVEEVVSKPEEVVSKPTTSLKVGLIGFAGWGTAPSETIRKATGVKYTRLEPGVEGWARGKELVSEGITPLVLYNPGLAGLSPATVAEGVKSFIPHMRELGISEMELGNEVYYNGSAPAEYAAQYRAAHEVLVGSGITLIADAWLDAQKPNGEWSDWEDHGGWCVLFVQALGYVPDAWSFHPYGPMNADHFGSGANRQGWGTVPRMISYMKEDHIYAPLNITEVGQATYGGGETSPTVTEAEQAADVKQYLTQAAEWGVASIYLYEAVDTGEGGYGLYSWPLKAKPSAAAFTETLAKLSNT
jgi:hypothetical protein